MSSETVLRSGCVYTIVSNVSGRVTRCGGEYVWECAMVINPLIS